MGEAELDAWLQARRAKKPLATNAPMFDGFITAIAAGPVGADPVRWITALLAVPHSAFETGGTLEFAAIKAAVDRFNALGSDLREGRVSPRYRRKANGDIDVTDWCEGFMAAVNLNPTDWRDALDPDSSLNRLLRPVMSQCKKGVGLPLPGLPRREPEIPVLALSRTTIPKCVAGLRQRYHTVWHDTPQPPLPRR
jgi:uncharacterized protein